jgi:hypothetical protein
MSGADTQSMQDVATGATVPGDAKTQGASGAPSLAYATAGLDERGSVPQKAGSDW